MLETAEVGPAHRLSPHLSTFTRPESEARMISVETFKEVGELEREMEGTKQGYASPRGESGSLMNHFAMDLQPKEQAGFWGP